MKTKIVTLPFDEYIELRNFKENFEKENSLSFVVSTGYNFHPVLTLISTDEALKKAADYNTELKKECDERREYCTTISIKEINMERDVEKNVKDNLKKMSIWQFLKWRKE